MKFIKYAIGLVIALSVIPMVVVAVTKLDEPRLKTIEFEVVDYDSGEGVITFSENTFDDIQILALCDDDDDDYPIINLISVVVNDVELIKPKLFYKTVSTEYIFMDDNDDYTWYGLVDTNTANPDGYTPTIGDKWIMTFDVHRPLPPLVKLLVGFAPLLFVGGVLLFMLNKRKFE